MTEGLPEPASFRVGCAEEDITPPLGVSLAGYFHDRIAEWIHDRLKARALVVEGPDGGRAAIVSCDLATMTTEVSEAAKALIAEEAGIPPGHVLICATHTHTGPEIRPDGAVPQAKEYTAQLPRKIADAVLKAVRSPFEATLHLGRIEVEGYSFNRLFRLKDGREVFGKRGREAEIIGPAGPNDPEMLTLSVLDRQGNLRALVVNFALHPDVIGGGRANFISADWPGLMGEVVKSVYGEGTVFLFLQGAAGDINQVPHDPTHLPVFGPAGAARIARGLAGAAMCATERAEPMSDGTVKGTLDIVKISYFTRDEKFTAYIEEIDRKSERTPMEEYLVRRAKSWPYDGKVAEVPIQALRIGEAGFVGFPAEMFVRLGLETKRYSPARRTFVVELANARVSTYVPAPDQAERGGYGEVPVLSRWLCADAGRMMVDKAIELLHKLWQDRG